MDRHWEHFDLSWQRDHPQLPLIVDLARNMG